MAIAGNSWTDVDDASQRYCEGGRRTVGTELAFPPLAHVLTLAQLQTAHEIKVANLHWLGSLITSD